MSVLFIQQPQKYSPAYNPLNFTFYSIDHGTEPDFKYIIDVEFNGVQISQHEVYNEFQGIARFDVSEVIKSKLTSGIIALNTLTTNYATAICNYRITVTEYYNGATGDSENSDLAYAFNGSLRKDIWLKWNWNEYTLNSDGTNLKKFLTYFPRTEKQYVRLTDSAYLGALRDGNLTGIVVNTYDSAGSLIDTASLPITPSSRMFVINASPSLITELDWTNVFYYEVEVYHTDSTSETYRFYIDNSCVRYPSVRLVWLNKFGVWDAYTFKLDSISESDIKSIMHEASLGSWSDNSYNYAIANGQHLTHLKEVTDRLILNSDWMRPNVQNWLARSLYESPLVYIESVDFVLAPLNCDCITFTSFDLTIDAEFTGGEVVVIMTFNEAECKYTGSYDSNDFLIEIKDENTWVLTETNSDKDLASLVEDCPIGEWTPIELVESVTTSGDPVDPIQTLQAQWSYEPVNVTNETSRQKVPRRDGLLAERVQIKRTFDYQSQIL